jgi:hypothetical protein
MLYTRKKLCPNTKRTKLHFIKANFLLSAMGGARVSPHTLSAWPPCFFNKACQTRRFYKLLSIRQIKTITLQRIENIFLHTKVYAALYLAAI